MKRLLLSFCLVFVSTSGPVLAQARLEIGGLPTCDSCQIVTQSVARLESVDRPGGGVVGEPRTLAGSSRGEFLTTSYQAGAEIQVFQGNGVFSRTLGREGSGPGEYRGISLLRPGPGDSIWVFDLAGRVSVLTSDLEFARSYRQNGQVHDGIVSSDGSWVLNIDLPTKGHRGLPLHRVSAEGEILESFGADPEEYVAYLPYLIQRSLAMAGQGCVWSVPRTRYILERWCAGGEPDLALERVSDWFQPYLRRNPIDRWSPIQPWIAGIQEDSEGLLWVLVVVASERWQELWEEDMAATGHFDFRMFETIIEVIDPKELEVVVSRRIQERAYGFVGPLRVYSYREDESGQPSISIHSVSLDRSSSEGHFDECPSGG